MPFPCPRYHRAFLPEWAKGSCILAIARPQVSVGFRVVEVCLFVWSASGRPRGRGLSRVAVKKPEDAGTAPRFEGVNELSAAESMQAGVVCEAPVETQPGAAHRKFVAPMLAAIESEKDLLVGDSRGGVDLGEQKAFTSIFAAGYDVFGFRSDAGAGLQAAGDQPESQDGSVSRLLVHESPRAPHSRSFST